MKTVARPSFRGIALGFAVGIAVAGAAACTTNQKAALTKGAIQALPSHERDQEFEATARVMEEKPELVEQFYAIARKHPALMNHLMATASADLKDPALAEMAAKHLVDDPEALEQVLVTSLDIIAANPKARAAMNRAMMKKAAVATDIMTDNPDTVARVLEAGLVVIEKKPQARKATLLAVHHDRAKLVAFAKSDPQLLEEMGKEILREVVKDKPALAKMLHTAKVLDDEGPASPPVAQAPGVPAVGTHR